MLRQGRKSTFHGTEQKKKKKGFYTGIIKQWCLRNYKKGNRMQRLMLENFASMSNTSINMWLQC